MGESETCASTDWQSVTVEVTGKAPVTLVLFATLDNTQILSNP